MHEYEETMGPSWEEYRRRVLPADAGPVQIAECRRAFYAGACVLYSAVTRMGDDEVSEASGIAWLEAIGRELKDFIAEAKGP